MSRPDRPIDLLMEQRNRGEGCVSMFSLVLLGSILFLFAGMTP